MRILSGLAAALWLVLATSPGAETRPVVVELYTSQGCSSCPPADEFMHKLAARDDVIALALHVDYWDYIGWKDIFASRAFSDRQRHYAIAGGRRSVYTPQMIIAGQEDVVGTHPMDVNDLIKQHAAQKPEIDLAISRAGGKLAIRAAAKRASTAQMVVHLVRYIPRETVKVKRGENAGRSLNYSNIVTDWKTVTKWDTRQPLNTTLRVNGDLPLVVIIQRDDFGPIEAAARLR